MNEDEFSSFFNPGLSEDSTFPESENSNGISEIENLCELAILNPSQVFNSPLQYSLSSIFPIFDLLSQPLKLVKALLFEDNEIETINRKRRYSEISRSSEASFSIPERNLYTMIYPYFILSLMKFYAQTASTEAKSFLTTEMNMLDLSIDDQSSNERQIFLKPIITEIKQELNSK